MHTLKTIKVFFALSLLVVTINLNAQSYYQTTSDTRFRSGPSVKYKSLGVIKNGEKVNVIEKTNSSWFKIEHNRKTGFVSSKLLIPIVETPKIEETPKVENETEKSNSTLFYIIGGIVLVTLIFIVSSRYKSKKANNNKTFNQANDKINIEKEQKDEIIQNILKNRKIEVTTSNSNNPDKDDSIIDVTGDAYNLKNEQSNLLKHPEDVPFWKHQYVYSSSEINSATYEQKKFYNYFKAQFLKGEYIDLEGNTNYAFILLFDLLNEFEIHKNIANLGNQLNLLGYYYPKTKSYADSYYSIKKPSQNLGYSYNTYQTNYTDYDYWKLGTKYKTKLNLNDEEVKLLNKLWYPSNNFCSIEFCCLEILKLYLSTIASLKEKCIQEQTTLDQQLTSVVDIILRNHFRYQLNSFNYKNGIESTTTEIYSNIFKHCENAVREHYGHKRKINIDTYFTTPEAKTEFETKIITRVKEILPIHVSKINPPDEATEIELYSQNTSRWKIKFEELTTNYKNNPKEFTDNILSLGKLNKRNPSIENIFFEASKFISKSNKEAALALYIHYLYHDLKSATFDNKQLTKTIQKNIFKTNEQLHDFEIIVSELVKDKNLEKALQGVSNIYAVKRKKIMLDTASIKEVQQEHSGTVELLNEYLKDEYEDENNSIKTQEINNEEVKIEITQKLDVIQSSAYISDFAFTQIHETTLEIFAKSSFTVPQSELETFARTKGVFKNQLVESINEICYEYLDDVLIEEEDEYYTINPNYYQRLLAK